MALQRRIRRINWRWAAALSLFLCGFIGLASGVSLTERPDIQHSDLLTKAYYTLGLFGSVESIRGNPLGNMLSDSGYLGRPVGDDDISFPFANQPRNGPSILQRRHQFAVMDV